MQAGRPTRDQGTKKKSGVRFKAVRSSQRLMLGDIGGGVGYPGAL